MRSLGLFHYILGIVLLLMLILLGTIGPEETSIRFLERNTLDLTYLEKYDDWVAGMNILTMFFIHMVIELFVGFCWRRNATRPRNLLLTVFFSGASFLSALFALVLAGSDPATYLDPGYTLLLNLLTFLLAFRIRQENRRSTTL